MNFYVAGILAGTQYNLRHEVSSDPTLPVAAGPTLSFDTGTPPFTFPATSVLVAPPAGAVQDVLLHAHILLPVNPSPPFLVATNLSGQLLWYYDRNIAYAYQPVAGGTFFALADAFTLREIDLAGNTVRETNTKAVSDQLVAMGKHAITAFHHDARPLPDGSTVVLAGSERVLSDVQGPGPVTIVGDMILVLDKDWQVKWVWDSFDHLDVTRKALLDEKCPLLCYTTAPIANDWLHSNSVTYSPADGNLLLSVRHQDWVIKIDYRDGAGTGEILWRLGKDGDFTMDSADPYPWFSHQHDVSYEPGSAQRITLYDNGNTRQLFPNATSNSRGQVLQIDETARTATLKLNADLGGYSSALGSAQKLSDGSYHFTSGLLSSAHSQSVGVNPDGSLNFVLQNQAPTYRSFRMSSLYTRDDSGPAGGEAQAITFNAVADKTFGDPSFAVAASASSGLPVTLRVVSGPATVSGNTVTLDGAGTVVLQADQYGNIKYREAQSVTRSFAVSKASQTVTFGALPDRTFGDPDFTVSVPASSGLPVSLSAANDCTVKAGKVHLTGRAPAPSRPRRPATQTTPRPSSRGRSRSHGRTRPSPSRP